MTFRDDRDALLARADALEREAERLRRENRSLRDDAEALRRAEAERAEVERAGAAERAEVERMAARSPTRKPPKPRRPAQPRPTGRFGDLLDESLSPTWSKLAWIVGLAACLPSLTGLGFVMGELDVDPSSTLAGILGMVAFAGYVVGYVVGLHLLCARIARVEARHERRRLAALPLPIDLDGYLKVLATAQVSKVLEVRITFADSHSETDRRTIADAATGGWRRVASAGWISGVLLIRSPELETCFHGKKQSWNSNVRVHRWFRRLARKVLVPIARAYPIASVEIS